MIAIIEYSLINRSISSRAAVQAEAMARAGIKADKFILLNVPDDVLIER